MVRPCLRCGALIPSGSYCRAHRPRNGSSRRWRSTRAAVLARDDWTCRRCGRPATHVDHVVPVSAGGSDDSCNLEALCARHNLTKGAG